MPTFRSENTRSWRAKCSLFSRARCCCFCYCFLSCYCYCFNSLFFRHATSGSGCRLLQQTWCFTAHSKTSLAASAGRCGRSNYRVIIKFHAFIWMLLFKFAYFWHKFYCKWAFLMFVTSNELFRIKNRRNILNLLKISQKWLKNAFFWQFFHMFPLLIICERE